MIINFAHYYILRPSFRPDCGFDWVNGGEGTGEGVREGKGEPYGALRYRDVPSVSPNPPLKSASTFSPVVSPSALAMTRGLPNGDADFFWDGNWPRMGESGPTGVPGNEGEGDLLPGITFVIATSS